MQNILDYDKLSQESLEKKRLFKKFNHPLNYAMTLKFIKETNNLDEGAAMDRLKKSFEDTHRSKLITGKLLIYGSY